MWVLSSISLCCVHDHFWAQKDELFYLRDPSRVLLCQMLQGLLTNIAWMLFWSWMFMLSDHLHKSWKATRFLEGIQSYALHISYQTKTSFLKFNCGFSPLWNLGTSHCWIYKHPLSMFYQERENVGELTEVASVGAAVHGGLQGSLQRILFWNWACPYLDGGLLRWESEITW